jgi:serine/threonine protein kinase
VAGTEAYMAPEVLRHYWDGTRPPKHKNEEINMKQDIFQLGLILYEICHKMSTNMEKMQLFKRLQTQRDLSPECPLRKDRHIEYQMIIHMTEQNPEKRPSAR